MTTFDIDNTKKTKHREVLESLVEQGHALQAIHNPHTWRLSALSLALHFHDCQILFDDVKQRWSTKLPFSEAWDVDFSDWKNRIWTCVINISSFTEEEKYHDWEQLCEADYETFLRKANECLNGNLPLSEMTDFLKDKNTNLKKILMDSGKDLSTLLSDIDDMLSNSPSSLYEEFYDNLMDIYMKETPEPYQIDNNGILTTYEHWRASVPPRKLPEKILMKIHALSKQMTETKFWEETWNECIDIEKQSIDYDGFGRYIFNNRKNIIGSKTYPCKNCLGKCFGVLALCIHLWKERNRLITPETNYDLLKEKIIPDIKSLEDHVKEGKQERYQIIWDRIFKEDIIMKLMSEVTPNRFTGGYNQKLVCNIIGLLCQKEYFNISKNKIDDEILYPGKTVYKYINEIGVRENSTNCVMTERIKQILENIIDNT